MDNLQFIQSLPLSVRIRAYNAFNNQPVVGATAKDILQWLLSGLDAHAFTRTDLENAGAKTPAPAQINDAVQAVASRAEQSALDALARADKAISESKNAAQGPHPWLLRFSNYAKPPRHWARKSTAWIPRRCMPRLAA